jgi:hypothetical protein
MSLMNIMVLGRILTLYGGKSTEYNLIKMNEFSS